MLTITCPECSSSNSISLNQPAYEGPFKCWKCQKLFVVRIQNDELKSCTPFSQEDFEKWSELQNSLNQQD